ncbi:MAG: hypothetical protein LIP10_06465 [Clostridiales bacterium]|nr:hypothetical protein [Clostridiales bacterium]
MLEEQKEECISTKKGIARSHVENFKKDGKQLFGNTGGTPSIEQVKFGLLSKIAVF